MDKQDRNPSLEDRFPSNSYSSKYSQNKTTTADATPVVSESGGGIKGKVKEKKKGLGERIAEAFISVEPTDIKDYLIFSVLIPGVKATIENVIHMILFPNSKSGAMSRKNGESRIIPVSYRSAYSQRRDRDEMVSARMRANKSELIFETRDDAEEALLLDRKIERDHFASVKDLYRQAHMPTEWTHDMWGWRWTIGASVIETSEGWLLKMPEVEER